jgi:hypothetical protein
MLDLSKIKQVPLKSSEYFMVETSKKQIVLHHTAGNSSGINTINNWNTDTRGRIATCVCISGKGQSKNTFDGEICQAFSSKHWGYHLGMKPEVFKSFGVPYQSLDKIAIGIEICAWGMLSKVGDKYYNYVNREVAKEDVCVLEKKYKGSNYYHKYTDAQIESVRQLLIYWNEIYGIPLDYNEKDMWELSKNAVSGVKGIYTHNSYRKDKSDVFPQPELIQMLKEL